MRLAQLTVALEAAAASSTPRVAWIRTRSPSLTASMPTTLPSSTIRLSSAVFSRSSPWPVSRNADRARPISARPPLSNGPSSKPNRSVGSESRTSARRSPRSATSSGGGKTV